MTSRTTARFWACYRALPEEIRGLARKHYGVWRDNPGHYFGTVLPTVSNSAAIPFRSSSAIVSLSFLSSCTARILKIHGFGSTSF